MSLAVDGHLEALSAPPGLHAPTLNHHAAIAPGPLVLQALKAAFTALMTCDAEKVAGAIDTLVQRLSQEAAGGRQLSDKESLVLRLNQQYPNDVGVLSAFFLNQVITIMSLHQTNQSSVDDGGDGLVAPLTYASVIAYLSSSTRCLAAATAIKNANTQLFTGPARYGHTQQLC
jgi:hypothetical protein